LTTDRRVRDEQTNLYGIVGGTMNPIAHAIHGNESERGLP